MDSVVDVGSAAYAQLQKIKGQSLDHAESNDGKRNVCMHPGKYACHTKYTEHVHVVMVTIVLHIHSN